MRSAAGARWRRERDERREQAQRERDAAAKPRDWFEDPLAAMFGLGVFGAYPEPPDGVALRILGLSEKPASQDAVKSAFRKRLMQVHPDLASYTIPSVRALWERVLGEDATVQELVWARDVLYKKIPPVPQLGDAARAAAMPKPPTEEERREANRRRFESKRTASLCGTCGHELAADQVVYRGARGYPTCEACATAPGTLGSGRTWRRSEPCVGCGRPVIEDARLPYRYRGPGGMKRVMCCDRCRATADRRERKAKRDAEREPVDCTVCGERVDARRRDVRYCSPACRQKAYRLRGYPPTSGPAATS